MEDAQKAKYKITGLVETFDENGSKTGEFPIGSVQELPIEAGTKAIEAGNAELVIEEEAAEESTATGEAESSTKESDEETAEESDEGDKGEDGEEEVSNDEDVA